jgi:hypothetical protein
VLGPHTTGVTLDSTVDATATPVTDPIPRT